MPAPFILSTHSGGPVEHHSLASLMCNIRGLRPSHNTIVPYLISANTCKASPSSVTMSGAARRRGRGRARGDRSEISDGSERLTVPAGGFDGPASRGSGSGTATSGRAASVTSGHASPQRPSTGVAAQAGGAGSRRSSTSGAPSQPPSQAAPQSMPRHDPALDPSRVPRLTDPLKNVDLPASFFNLNQPVSTSFTPAICKFYPFFD